MHRWSSAGSKALAAAGWHGARREQRLVDGWKGFFDETDSRFRMSDAAERALAEFGGLAVALDGPGQRCARGGFVIDPTLAAGEEDRFFAASEFTNGALFPLGEAYGGQAFLAIDSHGTVYLVGDDVRLVGADIYSALDAIMEGRPGLLLGPG